MRFPVCCGNVSKPRLVTEFSSCTGTNARCDGQGSVSVFMEHSRTRMEAGMPATRIKSGGSVKSNRITVRFQQRGFDETTTLQQRERLVKDDLTSR